MCLCCLLYVLDEVDRLRSQLNQDRNELLIASFCQPRLYSREAAMSGRNYDPIITWFKLSAGAHNMLVHLHHWKDSAIFPRIWKAQLNREGMHKNLTVDQIEQSIWHQSSDIWGAFCRGMVGHAVYYFG